MMESEGEDGAKPMKTLGSKVCQICGDGIGSNVDGKPFIACGVCAFPVCRACYEYERKDGNQSCPQCKTRYKRHKGSHVILGGREEDGGADNDAGDVNYNSENQSQKQKIAEHMLSMKMAYGRADEVDAPIYDKEVSHNHIPLLTSGQEVSGELSAASPERLSMASPGVVRGKRVHNLPSYSSDINQSRNSSPSSPSETMDILIISYIYGHCYTSLSRSDSDFVRQKQQILGWMQDWAMWHGEKELMAGK